MRVGRRGGGHVEILSGVRPGEQIAGKGAFLLKAELGKGRRAMRTKVILTMAVLAASLTASAAMAKDTVTIDRLGGREVEIITATARDTASGLRVFGLVRRASGASLPPVTAHLDISAYDPDGHWAITVPTRLAALNPQRKDREPARYEATFRCCSARR
ncbi:hypothetical protein ACRAWD_05190 [Caulobacter segnis]